MNNTDVYTFGELLTTFRKQHRISQNDLAARLDVHRNTIGKWERGIGLPESKTVVLELAKQLHLNEQETRQLLEASLTTVSPYWLMPYQRNPFFTGRDNVLQQLHDTIAHEHSAVLSQSYALSGLGGIGKTQTAIEYAYRYANEYAAVFWISAETNESIVSSFVAIAELLNLPEKQEKEQSRVMATVTRWLTSHSDWLLIFDNVEDRELVKSVLPPARCGSLLFTSRMQALGFAAQTLDVEQMTPEEGIRFLLHRARLLDPTAPLASLASETVALAREVVAVMDGLPLALDQAGAYIEETKCSLSDYLQLFQSSQLRLLDVRDVHSDHPSSVTRTFALAFEQLERNNPAAVELLTVCAFLAPEAIPETFFIEGATYLGSTLETLALDPFEFHTAIKALLAYSLIQRNTENRMVTIHRLVQVVLKGRLSETEQRTWARRVIETMSRLFPSNEWVQVDYWPVCDRLLPHALVCLSLGDQWDTDEVLRIPLMSHVAVNLYKHAQYVEAALLLERAVQMGEQALSSEYPLIVEALQGLADIYRDQARYAEAESLYLRALRIWEQALGSDHPQVASSVMRLGILYWQQSKDGQAEPLYLRALRIWEQALGSDHPQVAYSLSNLGILYWKQGKYERAEPFYLRALYIREQTFGPEHPLVAYPLNNLGMLYYDQGKYEQAEPCYQRALHIWEQALGTSHPQVAYPLIGLGILYWQQDMYELAEPLYQRALQITEQALGPDHPQVAEPLNRLANLYRDQGRYEQARPLYQRTLALRQQHLDSLHVELAETLHDLARFYHVQQQTVEALSLYQQALEIREQVLGPHHPETNATRTAYVHLLRELGRLEEAAFVESQVQTSTSPSL